MTHDEIIKRLESLHPPEQWAFATEVRTVAGLSYPQFSWADGGYEVRSGCQYIDAFAMNLWPSKGHLRIAYEIKASRSDWLRELRDSHKHQAAIELSHQFYFVLGNGVWRPEDKELVPEEAGVRTMSVLGRQRAIVRAPKREAAPMPEEFIAMLLRAVRREGD